MAENFLVPNGTIIVETVLLLIVVLVYQRWVIPPLASAMAERARLVQRAAEDRERARQLLDRAEREYQRILDEARAEAARIRTEARADGARIRQELRERARAEVDSLLRRGVEQLAAEREHVFRELCGEIDTFALPLAEKVLHQRLTTPPFT
jgi:F-type H+-transporting ATPase subunit b